MGCCSASGPVVYVSLARFLLYRTGTLCSRCGCSHSRGTVPAVPGFSGGRPLGTAGSHSCDARLSTRSGHFGCRGRCSCDTGLKTGRTSPGFARDRGLSCSCCAGLGDFCFCEVLEDEPPKPAPLDVPLGLPPNVPPPRGLSVFASAPPKPPTRELPPKTVRWVVPLGWLPNVPPPRGVVLALSPPKAPPLEEPLKLPPLDGPLWEADFSSALVCPSEGVT